MFSAFDKTVKFRSIEHMLEEMPGFCYSMPDPENIRIFSEAQALEDNDGSAETASLSDGEVGSMVQSSGDSDSDSGLSDGDQGSECGDSDELLRDQSGHEHTDSERDELRSG